MTRDEVLEKLKTTRAEFDRRVSAIPPGRLNTVIPDGSHTPAQIIAHVNAYEELITERLRAARLGESTAFDRDRVGWEQFNERVWAESAAGSEEAALERSAQVFLRLLEEVSLLRDEELVTASGVTESIDPAWLDGRALWELIEIDAFDHYPMHFAQLEAAATSL